MDRVETCIREFVYAGLRFHNDLDNFNVSILAGMMKSSPTIGILNVDIHISSRKHMSKHLVLLLFISILNSVMYRRNKEYCALLVDSAASF